MGSGALKGYDTGFSSVNHLLRNCQLRGAYRCACKLMLYKTGRSRTFNPADYTESSATDGFGTKSEIWETGQNDADDGTAENHVTPGQSIDLVTLLQKPVTSAQETEGNSFEVPQQQTFGQALVFTNSQHSTQMASGTGSSSAVNSYSPQSLVKVSYAF
ncbi:ubiquitin-associated protein 2 isoform x2 [Limosa lapponica baueri]|uniref:Ubiquitin-associated protein 2 isoform x2 n=1 Tax=Limosa lapponica baueri TaxID=1758121 RepID=A0A2I0THJ3_LIMLA|nr:ubiquitin-associated protein 2 isoform x2 [Limosa lapponica baueri]